MTKDIILDHIQIEHRIRRISYQIYETFVDEKEIIIAGVEGNGYIFATKISDVLQEVSPIDVQLAQIKINKQQPLNSVSIDIDSDVYKNKSVVVADDVLNTGSTLIYAVQHFLGTPLKKLKTTVLVNRNHKKFPIKADFKGVSLSTSSHNTIEVVFDEQNSVYLI